MEGAGFETCSLFFGEGEMKLTTDYREQAVGTLKGSKEYYLVGTIEFANEERTVAQERGLYDIYVNVPAATAPPKSCFHWVLIAASLDFAVRYGKVPRPQFDALRMTVSRDRTFLR
jgi:hypothetical protein